MPSTVIGIGNSLVSWGKVPILKHLRLYGEDIINKEKNKIVSTAVKQDEENVGYCQNSLKRGEEGQGSCHVKA